VARAERARAADELSFDEIRRIADEARALGTRKWGISGGEPMLRADFPAIFDYLTRRETRFLCPAASLRGASQETGFLNYSLNSNGTLITPEIARLLKRKGSKMIALYGATAEVYDAVTRDSGGFEMAMRGVAYLGEAGAGFIVQLIPMRANWHQWDKMIELPKSLSPHWRVGAPWLYLSSSGAPATTTITLTLPAAVSAPAQMRVNLWSATQDPADPDHHLQVFFNDRRVADESWDGQGARVITARLPADGVRAGVNTLRLSAPGDTRAQAEIVLLRSVEATYTRPFIAQDDALEFEGGAGSYRIGGFSGDAIDVFDITHPDEPTRIANTTIAARTVAFGSDADTPRRYLAVGPRARQPVARVAPMVTTRPQTSNADYVVITHPDFVDAVQPLVRWPHSAGSSRSSSRRTKSTTSSPTGWNRRWRSARFSIHCNRRRVSCSWSAKRVTIIAIT